MNRTKSFLISLAFIIIAGVTAASAQTSAFTYQGRLTDGVSAANGTYEMQFKLFDAVSVGTQIGSTITNNSVSVVNGVFSVNLDFGSSPFTAGANRWLEIGVRKAADPPGFTLLTPRQQITSSPYSLRTLSATSADSLSAACVTCVTDAQINTVSGSKVTGAVTNATNATNATTATTATTAGNVTGTVAVANGGTGATSAVNARTNLGLGTLATVSPTGTANATTFLRGDNSWQTIAVGAGAPILATRSTNLILNSGTYVDIISISLEANKTYFIESLVLGARVGATSGPGTFQLVYTGAATTDYGFLVNANYSADTVINSTPSFDLDAAAVPSNFTTTPSQKYGLNGYLRTTSVGTLTIRGARAAANTTIDLNVREGTYLLARPIN